MKLCKITRNDLSLTWTEAHAWLDNLHHRDMCHLVVTLIRVSAVFTKLNVILFKTFSIPQRMQFNTLFHDHTKWQKMDRWINPLKII